MDAFYASVEQRDNPELRGKPIAVGSSSTRGVVMTASYEARKFGVGSAQASSIALRKCPDLIFIKPRFDVYKKVSKQVRQIFHEYTDLVEPLSLDEAYLDVTINKKDNPSATLIAKEIKSLIKRETLLTASAGISNSKFLAKIASDLKKPDGLVLISPEKAESFIEKLPVEKFHGIGKATATKMHNLGIFTGSHLKGFSENQLVEHFGKMGKFYYKISQGIDDREVQPNRPRKSISVEITFEQDIHEIEDIQLEIGKLSKELFIRMNKTNSYGKTLTMKAKYSDFKQVTRSKTLDYNIDTRRLIEEICDSLIPGIRQSNINIRLLGIGISNFPGDGNKPSQLILDF